MEAAVAGIGKAVLNGVLSGAKAAITEDTALRQAVQRDVVFLTDELAAMRSYLRDADEERNRHRVTRSRVRHVRDLAYDIDDCLREYAVHLEKPSGWRVARTVLERHRIAEEMKGLRARAEDMNHRNLRYHLVEEDLRPSSNSGKPASSAESSRSLGGTSVQRQAHLFLESGQVDLVPLICTTDLELRVIAVWGASGGELRKTSVIRKAYDDLLKKNDQSSQSCAWIRVAHPFNPSEFLQSIVRQFIMNSLLQEAGNTAAAAEVTLGSQVLKKMETIEQHRFIDEFNKYVTDKRYLIVLNELSTIEDWDWIKTYFPNNKKGSRIIVSTEQGEVASLCAGPERLVVELKQSSTDQIIYAFCEKGTRELESCSGTDATDSNNSADKMIPTRKDAFIRRQKDINCIISKLSSDNDGQEQDYEVISICGKGGLGKTSLVNSVYQHEDLRSKIKFEKCAYVTIKHPFILKDLLGSLVKQLDKGNHGDRAKLEGQEERLKNLLEGKKCLIVFDDLSSTDEWDNIIKKLPKTGKGSRIIVTTSTENIAIHCSGKKDENIYKLESLGDDDARDLFNKTVFRGTEDRNGRDHDHPELAKEEKSILEKCKGFPLAIITIGGVLAKRPKTSVEWRKLNEYIDAELKTNPEIETTRTILLKCYDCLPYQLKSCFLYLSIFPEDRIISRRRLVQRWVAEGYSIDEHNKSAKEIAEGYFKELIDRSMIIQFVESIGSTKGIDSCKFNNLIHEMSTSKSAEENLVLRLEAGYGLLKTQGKIRHLSVISDNWNGCQNEFESIVHPSSIRSLTVFGKWRPFFMSERMRMLRVLDLEGTSGLNDHHLEHIGKLLHLKYLSLRGCHYICYLPHSLGNLRQLETLDIKRTGIIKLSKTVTKLRKLHYLRAGGFLGAHSYEEAVADVPKLLRKRVCLLTCMSVGFCVACCVPQLMNEVVYDTSGDPTRRDVCTTCCCTILPFVAGRLDTSGVVMPSEVSKLAALHTLATVNIGRRTKAVLQGIRRLTHLRKLGVVGVNKENKKEFCNALSALSNLETLSVKSSGGQEGLEDCLEFDKEFSPPEKLKSLKLYGKLAKLPGWVDKLLNLVKLSLWGSMMIQQAAMQTLAKLPKLEILQLLRDSFQGQDLCLTFPEGAFSKLSRLALILPGDLKSVEFKQGAMPELTLLRFCGLPGKIDNEFFSGLSSLKGLKEFMLDDDEYKDEFVANVREQLTQNTNRPLFSRYNY